MAKRTLLSTSGSPVKPKGRQPRPGIVHSSVYLPWQFMKHCAKWRSENVSKSTT